MSNILYANLPRFSTRQATRRLTVDATVGGVQFGAFTDDNNLVWFDVQDADVMMTPEGTAPTTTVGHRLAAGEKYLTTVGNAKLMKFIRQGGTSGTIQYSEAS